VTEATASGRQPGRRPPATATGVLMALAAVGFAVASSIHAGAAIPLDVTTLRDPFPGAAVPEAVIALVMATSALTVFTRRPAAWGIAVLGTLFALLGTVYGLTVTLGGRRTGDIAYHLGIIIVLALILGLLLRSGSRRVSTG
jgi:hypothetical protein